MTLSAEQRLSLLQRASDLREEVSVLTSARDAAFTENAQAVQDAKLIAEVAGLQRQRDAVATALETAVNSTDDAMAIMQRAVEAQAATASLQNSGATAPDRASEVPVDTNASSLESDKPDASVESDKPDASVESASTTKIKGGNR